jgi:hypothetical protein
MEVEKLNMKQVNESLGLTLKMNAAFNEFKKNRAGEYNRLVQKYKNRLKDLEIQQKNEINSIIFKSKFFKSF